MVLRPQSDFSSLKAKLNQLKARPIRDQDKPPGQIRAWQESARAANDERGVDASASEHYSLKLGAES